MPAELRASLTVPLPLQRFQKDLSSGVESRRGDVGWFMLDKYAIHPGVGGWEEQGVDAVREEYLENIPSGAEEGAVVRFREVEFDTSNVPSLLSSYFDPVTRVGEQRVSYSPGPGIVVSRSILVVPEDSKLAGGVDAVIDLTATAAGDAETAVDVVVTVNVHASYFLRLSVESLISSLGGSGLQRWAGRAVDGLEGYLAAAEEWSHRMEEGVEEEEEGEGEVEREGEMFFDTSSVFDPDEVGEGEEDGEEDMFGMFMERLDGILTSLDSMDDRLGRIEGKIGRGGGEGGGGEPPYPAWVPSVFSTVSIALFVYLVVRNNRTRV